MKILLATDGSQCAQEAAWFLSHLPHGETIELAVLTILHLPPVRFVEPAQSWLSECLEKEKASAQQAFEQVEAMFEGADANLEHRVAEGNPGEVIVEQAEQFDADLIVVGARGHSPVERILVGSTSDFVATHSDRSVLIVRPTGLRQQPERGVYVAFAYDDSPSAELAIQHFSRFSWGAATRVYAVSVVSYVSAFLNEFLIDSQDSQEAVDRALKAAAGRLRQVAPQTTTRIIESDHIGEGITEFAEEHQFDLIVMGDSQRSALGRLVLGSVPQYVLRHAPCSIWIARSKPSE